MGELLGYDFVARHVHKRTWTIGDIYKYLIFINHKRICIYMKVRESEMVQSAIYIYIE